VAGLIRLSADSLLGSANLVELAPWLTWRVPSVAPSWIVIYYSACATALVISRRPLRRAVTAVAAVALLVVATSPWTGRRRPAAGQVRITVLDVGQGDAIFVQLPTGQSLLVDTGGGAGAFDVGGRVVTPAIWALGVRRLDWLALTHGDLDHIGGAAAVITDLAPREIWEGIAVPRDASLRAVRTVAAARGAIWRTILAGQAIAIGGVTIDVRHPPAADWERQRVRNDDSLVLRLRYGDVEVLLTGDAGAEFERGWRADEAPSPIRILKTAHHGSRTSTSAAFVLAYRPQAALVSAGRGNVFGHPAPEVLARLAAAGAEVFRTDQDGAVIVETDGVRARVRTSGGKQWTMGVLRLST
jgi:competence protein ComEC